MKQKCEHIILSPDNQSTIFRAKLRYYNAVIISFNLDSLIVFQPDFIFSTATINKNIWLLGIYRGTEVYVDDTGYLSEDEYECTNNIHELIRKIKFHYRKDKFNKILIEEIKNEQIKPKKLWVKIKDILNWN